jgi:hypothetical protein
MMAVEGLHNVTISYWELQYAYDKLLYLRKMRSMKPIDAQSAAYDPKTKVWTFLLQGGGAYYGIFLKGQEQPDVGTQGQIVTEGVPDGEFGFDWTTPGNVYHNAVFTRQ